MEYYKKNEFYKDGGIPTELFEYNVPERRGYTHSRNKKGFAYVFNSLPVYSRLQTWEGGSLYPCGLMKEPATDGYWAKLSDSERDELCPKVAYGFSAFLLNYCSLEKDDGEVYLQPLYCKRSDLYKEYQKRCYQVYRHENKKKYERYESDEKMGMVAELDKAFWETHVSTEMGLLKKLSRKHIPKVLYAEIKSWAQAYVDDICERLAMNATEAETQQKCMKRERRKKTFYDALLIPEEDKIAFIKTLHSLIDGKRGRDVGVVLSAAMMQNKIRKPTRAEYESEFKLHGTWNAIYKYLDDESDDNKFLGDVKKVVFYI